MKEKHPSQDISTNPPSSEGCDPINIEPSLVLKKLRSFNKCSAAGPSGIRASHILSAVQVHNQTPALDILTDLINLLAKGLVPLDIQPFIAGAFLIGLSKKDGGIRPIAIGDVFRRLTGKCLATIILDDANRYFLPSQCVSASGGAEAVIHTWRSLLEEFEGNDSLIGMKIDFINAFNEVQRLVFLKECRDKFPQIFKWVNFCYSQHSLLFFGEYTISSLVSRCATR